VPPATGEALLIYVAATTQVVSTTVIVERQEEGHALLVQRPVYFISEVLSETKIRYPQIQKLLYAVILTRRKLRHYFESHPVTVVSSFPLGEIIQCREASGRIAKWAVELMGETLSFAPRKAIKSQVLADFLAEWVDTQLPTAPIQPKLWTMYFDGSLMKIGACAGLLFISPLGKQVRYVLRLHFLASNNVAEYEALVNGLHIAIELGVRRLDARGDSQLVVDQVMKNSHCRDRKMEAYCDEVRHLEDKFYGLELNHVARRYNETVDELAKIASGRTTVPPNVFSRDIYQPSVKIDDAPEPEETSAQPEVPSAAEGEALRVEEEQDGVTPNLNWQTLYLEYLLRGELPLDKAEAQRLARRAKSFVLLGDEKELYHRSPSGILQRCISIAQGRELLQEIHSGACGHHAAPQALVGNAFQQGFYWPTAVADATRIVRSCRGCQFYTRQTHLLAQAFQTIPITWSFAVWGLDLVGPLQKAPGGLHAPAGRHRQILQVDQGPTLNQHRVRAGGDVLHKHHPPLWCPRLHHHRQRHIVHWEKVPRLLRRPPHPSGLGRRCSPDDKRAGGARQWHDFAGTKAEDLQRSQQVWQAVDKRTALGGLESEDDAEPGHGLLAVFPSLWGRGHLTHGLGIRFPETKAYDDRSNQASREDSLDQLEEARDVALLHSARYQQSLRRYHARRVWPRGFQVGDLVLRL
jgi:ribonuclease HI